MAKSAIGRVGIVWRGKREGSPAVPPRLRPVFDALTALDVAPEAVVYSEGAASDVGDQLLRLDGVLVWVDPITGEHDRSGLDALLREVAAAGTWVSTHPDVILKMGTKEAVFRTRDLGWGADVQLYRSFEELRERFPAVLASSGPRVLKQNRGNGGIGVWKVELAGASDAGAVTDATVVRVQGAEKRDEVTEDVTLGAFIERCRGYFDDGGLIVDQAFQPRISDGMIRCYMIQDAVAGFAHQWPGGSEPAAGTATAPTRLLGLPAAKTMYIDAEPRFQRLRRQMESEWVPGLQRLLEIDRAALPLLWDADFLYGAKDATGEDTYVLCEINVSCVTPFPDAVPSRLAEAVRGRLGVVRDAH